MAAVSEGRGEPPRSTGGAIRALAAGCIGNFVEWYDFAIYSYSVTIIATLFFPEGNRAAAIIATFALYGVAFLARPVGGVFWGNLGDRIGRRTTLAVVVFIMGGATMLIGLLPTYGTIGILAPILLAVLRLVQGFSGGGEFTGSTSFISEYAPDEKRGLFASISATFTTLPSLLGGLTVSRPRQASGQRPTRRGVGAYRSFSGDHWPSSACSYGSGWMRPRLSGRFGSKKSGSRAHRQGRRSGITAAAYFSSSPSLR